jgi:hypothetical protein
MLEFFQLENLRRGGAVSRSAFSTISLDKTFAYYYIFIYQILVYEIQGVLWVISI